MLRGGYRGLDTLEMDARRQLLDGIIIQELLILEGLARSLERDSIIAEQVERVEQKALVDTLYARQAQQSDYVFTEEELQRFFRENEYDVEVRSEQIVCATKEKAWEALRALQQGESFASLVPQYSLPNVQRRFGTTGDIGWFRMGEMLEALKAPMRTMEVGALYPRPVASQLGHHAFRLNDRRSVSIDSVRTRIEERLRTRKTLADRKQYVDELRQRYAMQAHGQAIVSLLGLPSDQKYWEGEDRPLFTWTGGQLTIGDYLTRHRHGRVKHPASLDSSGLHAIADNLAGMQIMKTEARRLEYDRIPATRTAVEKKRDELLAKWLFHLEGKAKAAEVTEEQVRAHYEEHIDQFTRKDGKVTDFTSVRDGIRRALRQQAANQTMDRFIESLRENYRDRIEIRSQVLEKTFGGR